MSAIEGPHRLAREPLGHFLRLGALAAEAVRASGDAWDRPSALAEYTIGSLAAHLARAVLTVETYLDASVVDRPASADAAGYFHAVLGDHDPVRSDRHRGIRDRSGQLASEGADAVTERVRAAHDRLAVALADPAALARTMEVRDGIVLTVEDYLGTRVVELVVHLDDLAASGVDVPAPPADAVVMAAGVLGELAARRFGLDAVRSLARAERHPEAVRAM